MNDKTFKRTITSKELNKVVSSFTVYKFIKALTTPFTKTEAYRKGIIDGQGKYLKDPVGQISVFDRLIINIKVLLNQIPNPRIRAELNYLTTGIGLIAEDASRYGADPYEVFESIIDYFHTQGIDLDNFILEEEQKQKAKAEVTGHLPHVGELIYHGMGNTAIEHLKATHKRLRGKKTKGHHLSYKADGSISVVFGKHQGRPFVNYKTSPTSFYSEQEIENYAKEMGKPHIVEPFKTALRAASHEGIQHNRSYQADIILRSGNEMKGNLLKYKPPKPTTKGIFAVHAEIDTDSGKKISSNPNLSGLSSDDYEFPHLSMNERKFKLDRKTSRRLGTRIKRAERILSDKGVSEFLDQVAKHEDPSSKQGARRFHFKRFGQAVQEKRFPRNIKGFVAFSKAEMAKTTNKKHAARLGEHLAFGLRHKDMLSKTLRAHENIDRARQTIYDATTSEGTPMQAVEGGSHEGTVSELEGKGMVKFVPSSFTVANVGQKGKFKKDKKKKLKENTEMTPNDLFKSIIRNKLNEKKSELPDTIQLNYEPEIERGKGRLALLKHIANMAEFNPNLKYLMKPKNPILRPADIEQEDTTDAN